MNELMYKLLLFTTVLLLTTAQQSRMVRVKVSENITAKLPSDFTLLPPDELQSRSASYRMPIAFYTDPSKKVDFSVNNSASRWQEKDLEVLKDIYRSNIRNLFDNVEFRKESIETINDREFIVFEFSGTVLPGESLFRQESSERKYHYTMYTIRGGQIYIFTFSAPIRQQDQWQETASIIMNSIRIK